MAGPGVAPLFCRKLVVAGEVLAVVRVERISGGEKRAGQPRAERFYSVGMELEVEAVS